ncbi:peptide-methionine (S)-S-oxide reductase [Desulforamulus aeronauticus DSM 10349]|uniref:peptide-methionine (S)-S-oxide reductase n=1 Tax=Desulforamulus aeronauticus DSM 10349 TaxID=1121421 RepID=A0A1M6TP63_9FIRM|nr:peptide-methionine (S)-S-oxide reductase [Desulforamulus aeronauticus DSM 10349]
MQIDYDPAEISYEQLLDLFWQSHNPASRPWSRQYMSIIFYHNNEQANLAQKYKEFAAERLGKKIYTEINPYEHFYLAEDYHQKYYLQLKRDLVKEYALFYPNTIDFINSTSAARVNGYVRGAGTITSLIKEIESLGLSEKGKHELVETVKSFGRK